MNRNDMIAYALMFLVWIFLSAIIFFSFAQKEARLAGLHECERYANTMMWRVPAKCQAYFAEPTESKR